jgi:hypothetical protein
MATLFEEIPCYRRLGSGKFTLLRHCRAEAGHLGKIGPAVSTG